ncbi:MAG: hypothetical protein DRR16_04750 [Candidatus Parabeggiatoa sp. nov. 3]|nr:MAG: hypothetical protein DRR00_06305 [Gammaproteobacteria bacterium]RKZ65487.1 MAG: hypothetical protein DRQ99_12530 [Gammaproteobacteria bacterium]RKZ88540.1 MAG: hypothetical protein DRR16_04750 [Gammaproteobacteria bacterium]
MYFLKGKLATGHCQILIMKQPLKQQLMNDIAEISSIMIISVLSTEAQINRYFTAKGIRPGLPLQSARRGNPGRMPLGCFY